LVSSFSKEGLNGLILGFRKCSKYVLITNKISSGKKASISEGSLGFIPYPTVDEKRIGLHLSRKTSTKMTNNMINALKNEINNFGQQVYSNMDAFLEDSENMEYTVNLVRTFVTIVLMGWLMYRVLDCCNDPFGNKMRERLQECEEKLEESENTILGLEEELDETKQNLETLKEKFQTYKHRYVTCKQAAQRFIDTHAESGSDS